MHTRRWLAIAFFILVALRLYFAFSTPHFAGEESYFHLKQAHAVAERGYPLYYDPLSYQGRTDVFLPLFYYFLAPFSFSDTLLKILLNVAAASILFIIYEFAFALTKDERASLYAALVASFVPAYFGSTIARVDPSIFFIPLLFLLSYQFTCDEQRTGRYLCILLVLTFLSPLALLIPLAYALYLLLLYIERTRARRRDHDLMIFSIFFVTLILFFIYQRALDIHESTALFANAPFALSETAPLSIGLFVYGVGFVPFLAGMWMSSKYLFAQKNRIIYYLISLSTICVILLFARIIPAPIGFSIFGICMSILFAKAYQTIEEYFRTTRASRHWTALNISVLILFILTSVLSSIASAAVDTADSLSAQEHDALQWIAQNTNENATILSHISDGHYITAVAQRKTFIDSHYFFVDAQTRYDDHIHMLTAFLNIRAIELMQSNNITHIYYSAAARDATGRITPPWAQNDVCFPAIYNNSAVIIYERNTNCEVRTIET